MTKTKHSNRKVDLAAEGAKKTDPLDTATIVLDNKKLNTLAKSLPKIRKIKKEKVEVAHSVTTTSCPGEKTQSLEEITINPDEFLHLDEATAEAQVIISFRKNFIVVNYVHRLRSSKVKFSRRLSQTEMVSLQMICSQMKIQYLILK